jgi:hypothetical protein
VGELVAGIEERDEHGRQQAANERREHNLSRDPSWAARAAMVVGEVPAAAWTGRHANGKRRRDNNIRTRPQKGRTRDDRQHSVPGAVCYRTRTLTVADPDLPTGLY